MSSYVALSEPRHLPTDESPDTAMQKAVTIVDEPESITPLQTPGTDGDVSPTLVGTPSKQHSANIAGKKLTGRPPLPHFFSTPSLVSKISNFGHGSTEQPSEDNPPTDLKQLLSQVVQWLYDEKAKRYRHGLNQYHETKQSRTDGDSVDQAKFDTIAPPEDHKDLALDKLEHILAGYINSALSLGPKVARKSSTLLQSKGSLAKKFKRHPSSTHLSSDTEFFGDEILVPNVEAKLDNTKTMAYLDYDAGADQDEDAEKRGKDEECWVIFKQDILRLTHTMNLKGWRKIPIEQGGDIEVARLCGALTNAVYVVKPPKKLPERKNTNDTSTRAIKTPKALLLRVYGPQTGHLVDRDSELGILRRLAKKKIGPRLLGTFQNGRFEEYLNAETLTPEEVRVPETSKSIAKRMRELHEGIDLIESEIEAGPHPFQAWDKWVDRCSKVITWLDQQVLKKNADGPNKPKEKYTKRGFICGAEWPLFRKTFEKYREHVFSEYGGEEGLKKKLMFVHNDTQYGNLMRLRPEGESPLMQPANQHKQLVVIDFEYAGPGTVGYEFADHFTEWCYNYHHPELSWYLNPDVYPTPQEQYRFVRSYVMHRPQFNSNASDTPKLEAREKTKISDFMLDARTPTPGTPTGYDAEEKAREKAMEDQIQQLIRETKLWRVACSAHWVAWGIVQAPVPEVDALTVKSIATAVIDKVKDVVRPRSDPLDELEKAQAEAAKHDRPETRAQEEAHQEGDEEEEEEFEYLGYAQDRAFFFWGDCVQLGLVKEEELPEETRKKLKLVKY